MANPGKMSLPANIEVISIDSFDAFLPPSLWMEEERQANYDTFKENTYRPHFYTHYKSMRS